MSLSDILILYRARLRAKAVLVQELFAVAGIAVGVALLFGSQIASTSLARSVSQLTHEIVGGGQSLQLDARGPEGIPQELLTHIAYLSGVRQVLPIVEAQAIVIGPRGQQSIDLIGTDPHFAHAGGPLLKRFSASQLTAQRAIALPAPLAQAIGVGPLQTIKLQIGSRVLTVLVAATVGSADIGGLVNSPVALTNIGYAQALAGLRSKLSRIFVRPVAGQGAEVHREMESVAARVNANVEPGNFDATLFAVASSPARLAERLFSAISAIVAFLFALNAMFVVAPERRSLIEEVLRPQGATRKMIVQVLLFDACVIAVLGCALGLVLGDELSIAVFRSSPDYLSFAFPVGNSRIVTAQSVLVALGAGVVATICGVIWPFRDILRRPQTHKSMYGGGAAIVGVVLLVVSAVLLLEAPKDAVLASVALLVSLVCLLPFLFDSFVTLFDRGQERLLNGAAGVLASVELRSPVNRVRSLAITATAAISLFGVVQFQGAQGNLQHGLDDSARDIDANADVWITLAGTANTFATTPFTLNPHSLAGVAGIRTIGVYRGSFLDWGTRRIWVLAPPSDAKQPMPPTQLRSGELSTATAHLRGGGWAVLSQALAADHHLRPGSSFLLASPRPVLLRVAGLSTNLAWPSGAIVMNSADYARAWGSTDASAYQVQTDPGVSPEALRFGIKRALGSQPGLAIETRAERQARHFASSRDGLSRLTQIRTLLLIATVLAVAGAIAAMIWQRRDLVSVLRCEGYSQWIVWRWLCWESALLVAIGSTIGALFGLYGQVIASHYLASVTGFPVVYSVGVLPALASLGLLSVVTVLVLAIPGYFVARTPARAPSAAY
ncbi:MAG TPA: FtsX-like permease family protein [Solirubrobacteraceae bacterium]|jgi:putative ABC transport system permease protein|nr:FtsX-like permease family protein [Solirubrobacteraceae bacterium]